MISRQVLHYMARIIQGCKAEKLKVVTSKLFYEIRQDELQGTTCSKFPADAGFMGDKLPAKATVLREKIKDTRRFRKVTARRPIGKIFMLILATQPSTLILHL
jgi:hypothetical protein